MLLLLLLGLVAFAGDVVLGKNYIVNGNFESGAEPDKIDGWEVEKSVDWVPAGPPGSSNGWVARSGVAFVDLGGNGKGSIKQTFNTKKGAKYRLSFWAAGNFDGGGLEPRKATVHAGNEVLELSIIQPRPWSTTNPRWEHYAMDFAPSTRSVEIWFEGLTDSAHGVLVDDVVVVEIR